MRCVCVCVLAVVLLACGALARDVYHGWRGPSSRGAAPLAELTPEYWARVAREALERRLAPAPAPRPARNVVMFLGDGMSVPTLAAARTLLGQRAGQPGEEAQLHFESFPTTGLLKTYCVDAQVADSACSATAYLGGVKGNYGTVGLGGAVPRGDCGLDHGAHRVASLAQWALDDGRDAGVVTTTRVTHASPAGVYAHSAERDWESDADVRGACGDAGPADIALQLVRGRTGARLKVVLGGGRRELLPSSEVDEEGAPGRRADGRNLIDEWREDKRARNVTHRYVWNRDQLMEASADPPEYLLGLFESSHMRYHAEADPTTEPTLAELTEVAVRALRRNERGFFLFVEGGRIDHAHHEDRAHLALDETLEMSEAVRRAADLLDERDSLLVVTSDHAHVMTISGYAERGAPVTGPSDRRGEDGVPYMTLSYANGPGFRPHADHGVRQDIASLDYHEAQFQYEAMVPLSSETHGGEDVALFARGPHHALFSGLYEQSHVPHLVGYAACLGPGLTVCDTLERL